MDNKNVQRNSTKIKLDNALIRSENILVSGLSGFGKTAIVKEWLEENKDKINGYYIDGTFLQKCSGEVRQINDLKLCGQMFSSDEIDTILSLPKRVIVVDNYNLLSDEQKYHILLLSDGFVIDNREESGLKRLDNLEFVCLIETI